MRCRLAVAFAAACVFCCVQARADSIFQINDGTTELGGSFYGTFTIDTVQGFVSAADIFYTGGLAGLSVIELKYITGQQANFGNGPEYVLVAHDTPAGTPFAWEIDVDFNTPTLVNYAGSTLCTLNQPCHRDYTAVNYFRTSPSLYDSLKTGSVTAVAATPEPSSLTLLGTGVLGLICAIRRRWA